MRALRGSAFAAVFAMLAAGCGGSSSSTPQQAAPASPVANRGPVSMDKNSYPVFPDKDAGADPSVPADQGGKGFTGEGWQTNADFDLIGDPHAVKGGVLHDSLPDFPGTLRYAGPESNSYLNYKIVDPLVYEVLVGLDPTTLKFIPQLATHWRISKDQMTYWFRIDPNARFSDGTPVTADDVVATWRFAMDKGLQDPSSQLVYGKFDEPVAESKYIVRVHSKVLNWRNFLYFGNSLAIFPAHVLKTIDGASYLKDYNFKLLPGSGPYVLNEADVDKGKSVTLRRRKDYWAEHYRRNVGLNNFDEIHEAVVRDQNLAFEMLKRGDLDFQLINVSRRWVEELNIDQVNRGLLLKRKIFNDAPQPFSGLAFNMRRKPWDDVRVREALAYLMNRRQFIQKLFYNEYVPLNSYYPGGLYENPSNPKMEYDPQQAVKLLADAGWGQHDADGRLVKNGQPLTVELLYSDKGVETWLTVYQDDLRQVGITMNLRLVTPETLFKLIMQRQFQVVYMGWGSEGPFPNPETLFSSSLADQDNNNNITGFKNARVDELLKQYDVEFDQQKRVDIIREIDGLSAASHHYALLWDGPFQRLAYWNKFGQPQGYLTRIGDYSDLYSLWWIDPQKQAQLDAARRDSSMKLPVGETDVHYWEQRDAAQSSAPAK
jgi:microcin C transport system substrate-binding protein